MQTKITIRNEAQTCYIDIEGTIGVPEECQFEDATSRVATFEAFRREVKRITEVAAKSVVVNIRSTGGDVNDALLIYDALRALDAHITTRCYGYTASAATIIAQAADEGCREISGNALYLIHNSTCSIDGNSASLDARAELLRKTDEQLARLYALHSGGEAEFFLALMAENNGEGRWLSAEEAIELGLADSLIDIEEEPHKEPATEEQTNEEPAKEPAEEPKTGKAPSEKELPSDQSTGKPARKKHPHKQATSETAWGAIIRYLLNRLAIRLDEWIDSLQEKRQKKKEEQKSESSEQTAPTTEKNSRRGKRKTKEEKQTEQTEQPSHESPTPEPTPSENSAKADGANAEKALPQATAAKSSVLFTERQRHFMASKLKSIEDPSPNSTEFGTNMRSYADDAKAFGR
ncbi:MAG: Clp protease ClpP [Alistipes sp.]|nr:Clp protease ClpP [Alistipes sp.]